MYELLETTFIMRTLWPTPKFIFQTSNQPNSINNDDVPKPFLPPVHRPGLLSGDNQRAWLQGVSPPVQPPGHNSLEVSWHHIVSLHSYTTGLYLISTTNRYENTEKSALYTYEVDVCFMAVLGAKLSFPWIYEYYTGNSCKHLILQQIIHFKIYQCNLQSLTKYIV